MADNEHNLDADDGWNLPSDHEELPRWKEESSSPKIPFVRRARQDSMPANGMGATMSVEDEQNQVD